MMLYIYTINYRKHSGRFGFDIFTNHRRSEPEKRWRVNWVLSLMMNRNNSYSKSVTAASGYNDKTCGTVHDE